jgi:hypothetical protein
MLAPIAALLADEVEWMREQFDELPVSSGTDIMRDFLDAMDSEAVALGAQIAAGPIKVDELVQTVQRIGMRIETARRALEPIDERLHFLMLAGGSVMLTWRNEIRSALDAL